MGTKINVILFFTVLFLFNASVALSQNTLLYGKVRDKVSKETLPGANILLQGTSIGTVTNIDGEYVFRNLDAGTHTFVVSYIGYKSEEKKIEIIKNEENKFNFELTPEFIEINEVVITAQAQGQMQAINQQLSALSVMNVISKKTIQELPESNAAEAVGRLPGVSLERDGGEGTKLVVRGMQPKYTKIQVDGINMSATGARDRSVDLSMISPEMLEGVELSKSIMANQEATATGGIVNFKIKEAPEKPTFNILAQAGYNSLENRLRDYKMVFGGSSRFFNKRFGIYAQINIEQKDASSDQLGDVEFDYENSKVLTRQMSLYDINRTVKRKGAMVVLDYTLPLTKIKLNSFASRINRDEQKYGISYRYYENQFGRSLEDNPDDQLTVITNSLKIEHTIAGIKVNTSLSYAYSNSVTPEEIRQDIGYVGIDKPFGNLQSSSFVNLDPYSIPDSVIFSDNELVNSMNFEDLSHEERSSTEENLAFDLSLSYDFNLNKNINLKLELGGKMNIKKVKYEQENYIAHFTWGGTQIKDFRDAIIIYYWDQLSDYNRSLLGQTATDFRYVDFVDHSYVEDDFLNNRYDFGSVPDLDMFRTIDNMGIDNSYYYHDNVESQAYDFWGDEKYYAFYVMPQVKFGSKLTFIPGLRYESNRTEYTGYRANLLGLSFPWDPFYPEQATYTRENSFLLPMIHVFYQPLKWLNIKAGYTHTLQRPDYWDFIPSYIRDRGYIQWRNYKLEPELAKNIDIQASVFSSKIGLISLAVFHKQISNMIFFTGERVITDPEEYELPDETRFAKIEYMANNEFDVFNYGIEFEWQSNLYFLPGVWKGLVCNVNYTRNLSDAKYLRTKILVEYDENYQPIYSNIDTNYANPMIMQPDHLFNLTLGFDYKGFSIRGAMRFSSHIFKTASWHEQLRGYSTDFYRFDLALKQKMPLEGLELFLNANNITNESERDIINHKHFTSYQEYYGGSVILGVRYQFTRQE